MENDLMTTDEMLRAQAQGLREANKCVDMKTADIAVQEQYRRNAETILKIAVFLDGVV